MAVNSYEQFYLSDVNMYQWIIDGINTTSPTQNINTGLSLTTIPTMGKILSLNIISPVSNMTNTITVPSLNSTYPATYSSMNTVMVL